MVIEVKIVTRHFERDVELIKPPVRQQILAYQAARRFIESHGGRIRNAGAGSPLRVFDEVRFGSLFD